MKNYTCCFFGHRNVLETEELKDKLYKIIENLIVNENVCVFLFGSKSEFDRICLSVVSELKNKYFHIKRIYVRAENEHIDERYRDYLLKSYDETYFPKRVQNAGKASYIARNYEMIDKSDFCVCYYNKAYQPKPQKRKGFLPDYQTRSGTAIAYEYAKRKKLFIINAL